MRTYRLSKTCVNKLMLRTLTRSGQRWEKANSRIPLGVSSDVRYWGEHKTIYVDHCKGGRITDIGGRIGTVFEFGNRSSVGRPAPVDITLQKLSDA